MALADLFTPETKTELNFKQLHGLTAEAVKYDLLMNGIKCNVPHAFLREVMTGKKEEGIQEPVILWKSGPSKKGRTMNPWRSAAIRAGFKLPYSPVFRRGYAAFQRFIKTELFFKTANVSARDGILIDGRRPLFYNGSWRR